MVILANPNIIVGFVLSFPSKHIEERERERIKGEIAINRDGL